MAAKLLRFPALNIFRKITNFASHVDAGGMGRRLASIPNSSRAINDLLRRYGTAVVARSRYLAMNNPYAASARETFVSALVGDGIVPNPTTTDVTFKATQTELWNDWVIQADADNTTDLNGLMAIAAGELFDAGEVFVRFRPRRPSDGLSVPLQLQLIPTEQLPLNRNFALTDGRVECGIEFDPIGRRRAYHFYTVNPSSDLAVNYNISSTAITIVPADQVIHLYRPIRAGQLRGFPHTLSAITSLAMLDLYDDAELERKRTAALFAAFIKRNSSEDDDHPLGNNRFAPNSDDPDQRTSFRHPAPGPVMEPGATIDLEPGEDVQFSSPADVGNNYDAFQYRMLLRCAAGFGVPYADMTGDLRQANYSSIRAGLIAFRRRIGAMQQAIMIHQFCRQTWNRWQLDAILSGALPLSPRQYQLRLRELQRVDWMPPAWDWVDPLKDVQAEVLAINNHLKPRSSAILSQGYDPIAIDTQIKQDREREIKLGNIYPGGGVVPSQGSPSVSPQRSGDPPPTSPPPGPDTPKAESDFSGGEIHVHLPGKGVERTRVTKWDAEGRILEFERYEVDE